MQVNKDMKYGNNIFSPLEPFKIGSRYYIKQKFLDINEPMRWGNLYYALFKNNLFLRDEWSMFSSLSNGYILVTEKIEFSNEELALVFIEKCYAIHILYKLTPGS